MPELDLLELFARPLHRAGARYLVAGSVGAMLYSEPRLTIARGIGEELISRRLGGMK